MNIFPHGQKQWLYFGLRLSLLSALMATIAVFITVMPGRSYTGPFEPLSADEMLIRDNLYRHVYTLADSIGERNRDRDRSLQAAADYIKSSFEGNGYRVLELDRNSFAHNIEAQCPGGSSTTGTIVVGAHYDSVVGSPGANDNASGVAALLELARLIKLNPPSSNIRLVAFANEEPPFFDTSSMGSSLYARRIVRSGEHISGMISLETIGCYSDDAGSQSYPFGFGLFYPAKGNFIAFVGNLQSRGMVRSSVKTFREAVHFPSEGIAAPEWLSAVSWSDHSSFWKQGIPAIMVTDTALFRYRYYHTAADTVEKIDYDRMARVVSGIWRVIVELCPTSAN